MAVRRATVDDAEAIERIRVETWRATYRGLLPDGLIDQLQTNVERRRERLRLASSSELNFVAEEDTVVVGYAFAGPERTHDVEYRGEVYAIYVLPVAQGKGPWTCAPCGMRSPSRSERYDFASDLGASG
jgi:GNAT superfamily N-acetyltransferase